MNLDQLAKILESAKLPQDLFGEDPDQTYRDWAKICHPDRFASSPDETKERAKQVFTLLEERFSDSKKKPEIWTPTDACMAHGVGSPHEYHIGPQLGSGEISKVLFAVRKSNSDLDSVVLKIAHVEEANGYLEKEAKILADIRSQAGDRKYGEYFPKPIESFKHDSLFVAVQQYYDGFYSLSEIIAKHPNGLGKNHGRHLAWMFKRILTALGFAHSCNYIHCAPIPPHLLFHVGRDENHGCKLLSWANALRSEQKLAVVPLKYKPWYPKKEISKQYPATPSLDIFLAAKSMLEFVKTDKSGSVPAPLQSFLESCVVQNPVTRPQDAWKLLDEWSQLLKRVFGPPLFVRVDM
jgi:serine/threonine protein kinase